MRRDGPIPTTYPNPAAAAVFCRTVRLLVSVATAAIACASAPAPVPAPTAAPPVTARQADLPRSSIAAILLHRDELALTSAQGQALSARDDALAREDEALRARLSAGSSAGSPPPSPMNGTGGRGGRHGIRHAPAPAHAPDLLTQLDDNDTRAYLEIEQQVLTEKQRPPAREIASAYREALYDQQHPSAVPAH